MPDCSRIKEVEKRYAEAETALKAYERITLTNLAPAINQLRYAGNHLLRASSETDDAEQEKHILAAEWHSRRALYDAREATVIFLLDEFREFRDSLFTEDELKSAMPNWPQLSSAINDGRRILESAGMAKHFNEDVLSTIESLLDVRDNIAAAMPKLAMLREKREVDKRQAEQDAADEIRKQEEAKAKARERKSDRIAVLGILLSVASILLAIVALGPIRRFILRVSGIDLG